MKATKDDKFPKFGEILNKEEEKEENKENVIDNINTSDISILR